MQATVDALLRQARKSSIPRPRWKRIVCCEDDEFRTDIANELYHSAAERSFQNRDVKGAGDISLEVIAMLPSLTTDEKMHWRSQAATFHNRYLKKTRTTEALTLALKTTESLVQMYIEKNQDDKAAISYESLYDAWPRMPIGIARELLAKAATLCQSADDVSLLATVRIRQKYAIVLTEGKEYLPAALEFESLASSVCDNNYHKYSTRNYIFKAGLCRLACGDDVMPDYHTQFPIVDGSAEMMILKELHECTEVASVTTKYRVNLQNDDWLVNILLDIKKSRETTGNNNNNDEASLL